MSSIPAVNAPPSSSLSPLLALPPELREHIYHILLTPLTPNLVIRSLFIRTYYRNVFMTQQPIGSCTTLLRVNRQIYHEAQPILYALPLWQCQCRFDHLASQIGMANFGLIKRMAVDADDLKLIAHSLMQDDLLQIARMREQQSIPSHPRGEVIGDRMDRGLITGSLRQGLWQTEQPRRLRFTNLEALIVQGYQAVAVTESGDRKTREEALNLCSLAQLILDRHALLSVVVQAVDTRGGGADAIDITMGRVEWRFLRHQRDKREEEDVVDLQQTIQLIRDLMDQDVKEGVTRKSSLPRWTNSGEYQQYPYLPHRQNPPA